MQSKKNKEFICCFPKHQQADPQPLPGMQSSLRIMISWGDKHQHSKVPSFFTPAFIAKHDTIWYRMFFWAVEKSTIVAMSLSCAPPATCLAGQGKRLKSMALFKHCHATSKASVCYHQYIFIKNPKHLVIPPSTEKIILAMIPAYSDHWESEMSLIC